LFDNGLSQHKLNKESFIGANEIIFVSKTQYKSRSTEFSAAPECAMNKSEKTKAKTS
jgi:hypothetical protein